MQNNIVVHVCPMNFFYVFIVPFIYHYCTILLYELPILAHLSIVFAYTQIFMLILSELLKIDSANSAKSLQENQYMKKNNFSKIQNPIY